MQQLAPLFHMKIVTLSILSTAVVVLAVPVAEPTPVGGTFSPKSEKKRDRRGCINY